MWINNEVVPLQRQHSFYLEHGDYLRIAIPPLPSADAATSTRTCVSQSRPRSHRLRRQAVDLRARLSHETGMTDVDAYDQPSRRTEPADDDFSLIQYDIGQFRALLPTTNHMLATETATLVSNSHCDRSYAKIVAKLDDAPTEQVQQARDHVLRRDPLQVQLAGQPEFIGELLQVVTQRLPHFGTTLSNAIFVETWFSDHVRRPHSGIGRVVRLEADFRTWYTAIVMAWEDHIDPFQALACYIADPQPDGGDPEVMVHLVMVQQAQPNRVTTLVSISDTAEDPWHPRLMCLTLSQTHLRQDLLDLVDLDHRCATSSPDVQCRMWWHEHEITPAWHEPLPQAATLLFSVQHAIPWHQPAPHSTDDEDEAFNLLQTKCQRKQLRLDDLVESCVTPSWVKVNCHKVIFLRQQLRNWQPVTSTYAWDHIAWRQSTRQALQDMVCWTDEFPLGFSFYTDGSAKRGSTQATSAVVLLVHTDSGLRWGGYLTTPCIGTHTAPRAEATALLLAIRWCCHLQIGFAYPAAKVEFAFDCQTVAGVAQGQFGSSHNSDLLLPIRALLHWLEVSTLEPFIWTHLRGHSDHPWNEAADTLCHHARRYGATVNDMFLYQQQCTFDDQDLVPIQWLWMLEKSMQGADSAPPLYDSHWHFNIAQTLNSIPSVAQQPIARRRDVQPDGPRIVKNMILQIATANVLTLFPGQDHASQYMSARAEGFDSCFHELGIHFVGLQETRSRQEGHVKLPHYHVLSSPATQRGIGGVQLWIQHQVCHGDVTLKVETSHLHILHATASTPHCQVCMWWLTAYFCCSSCTS